MLKRNIIKIITIWFFIFFTIPCLLYAMDGNQTDTAGEKNKINIMANTLIFDNEGRFAEFSGKVRAVEENSVLTADKMKIFFSSEMKNKTDGQIINQQSIRKILAEGNVEIQFDDNLAVSEKAEYSLEKNILVLTGENTRVTNGKNYITGNKITINRVSGSVSVEGGGNGRVEAEFISDDKNNPPTKGISFDKLGG